MKYNKNITLFNEEQQKFVADSCEGLMRTFGYAQQGEFHAILSEDDQWLQEQQTSFKFAKYNEVDTDLAYE